MFISDIKKLVANAVDKNSKVAFLIVGTNGIGKTQAIEQVAKEKGIGFVDLRLATQEPADLIGLPYREEASPGIFVTRNAAPDWFPVDGTSGILFLDELNRAPTDVRQAVFQLVKERRLHRYTLPDNWLIVAAANPDNGNYQVETLDKALIRRFCVLRASTNADIWGQWAKDNKVHDSIREFINTHNELLTKGEEAGTGFEQEYQPDQYAMLSSLLNDGVTNGLPKGATEEVVKGLIGSKAAAAYIKYVDAQYQRPVTGNEILTKLNATLMKRLDKQKSDEMHSTINSLVQELSNKTLNAKEVEETLKKVSPVFIKRMEFFVSLIQKLANTPYQGVLTAILAKDESAMEKMTNVILEQNK